MRALYFCLMLLSGIIAGDVLAGEVREIKLNDGSIIKGEVLSLNDGIYTLKSASLGTLKIEESKIRSITSIDSIKEEIQDLKQQMINDKDLHDIIISLR
ncbi:hypothetical protein ACFL7M_00565 [Thermodesulfobacteriota bacterium]